MAVTLKLSPLPAVERSKIVFNIIKSGSTGAALNLEKMYNRNVTRSLSFLQNFGNTSYKNSAIRTKPTRKDSCLRKSAKSLLSSCSSGAVRSLATFLHPNKILSACQYFTTEASLKKTALHEFHVANDGKMVPFSGYEMPIQYGSHSISDSHLHTRNCASIFDVSHMLQSKIHGSDRIRFMECLVVADLEGLKENQGTLTLYTNEKGGIIDDLIVTKTSDGYLYVVSNAGCIDKDLAHVQKKLSEFQKKGGDARLEILTDQALIALQGPKAAASLQSVVDVDLSRLLFMMTTVTKICGIEGCRISRCGYTGEDGFEISVPGKNATVITQALLELPEVKLAGLGARDTLRLEAGLCLYGNDMNEDTTPVEAGLVWTIGKRRKEMADFPGANIILEQIRSKPQKKRVGFISKGPPARAHTPILAESGQKVGEVTSGGPSPCLKSNVAMGYVRSDLAKVDTLVLLEVRKKTTPAQVVKMPFVPTHYYIPK